MMLPDELEWVLQMLGFNWPTADEDKLRDSAALWRKFGDDVTGLHTSANSAARMVTAHNAGESIDKFSKTYKKFDGGDGSDGYLANAAQAAHIIANVMEACAYLVEFAKWAVIAQLIALAIQIAAAAAAAPFTFGLSSVAGMGATAAARLIVRRLLDELKQALLEAIIEAMKEPAISAIEAIISDLIRQTVNVGFGAQQGFDLAHTMKTGGTAGLEALKQSPQTLAEGVRDSLGKKAGDGVHNAVDSRIDGYRGPSGLPGSNGDGSGGAGLGSSDSGGSDSGSSDSGSSDSGSSDSGSSNSSSDSSSSTRASTGSGPGVNIGGGISADAGGAGIGGPDVGSGPDSGAGSGSNSGSDSGSGQGPSSSDSPYSRPAPSLSGPSLSDFDDPAPGGASPSTPSTNSSPGTNGGPSVSGLSSPTPQSAPTPTSSGGPSSSSGGGSIGTQIDGLATSVPTQSNAAPTPTTADPSPAGSGGRTDGGSAVPTSPVASTASAAAGGTAGSHHAGSTSGSTPSATSPTPNSGAARNPSASTPGTPSSVGTGPASTPNPTSPTTPRSTPATTPADGRSPGAADGRTPGTPDGRMPGQRIPGTTPGDGTPPRNAPGTTPGDRTPPRDSSGTTPGDRTPPRNNPGTTPGDRTPPPTGSSRTPTPGQNPSTTNPSPNPDRSTPSRTAAPSPSTPTTTPSTSSGAGPDRTSTPSGDTSNASARPGAATSTSTPGAQNQPGTGSTPTRPPQQPPGSTPNAPHAPGTPQQPTAQPHTPPNPQHQQQQQQVTAVPIHTVVTTPSSSTPPSHATPATPQPPGSPQADPGTGQGQQHAQQDSLDDIRADLDHYPGGLSEPDPSDQQALADAVPRNEDGTPERFPDPFGPWTQLQNDGGNEVPGRSNNCADCSRSFLETWYGDPQVSAPRTLDTDEHGNPDPWSPEDNANANQIRWTGAAHTYAGPGNDPDTANRIASVLQQAGPGSAAIVQVDWPGGGGHAFNAVNHNGNIIWIDTQSGEVSHDPLHLDNAAHVWHIPLDADRNPIDLTQPAAEDSGNQSDASQNQQDDGAQPEKSETSETSANNGQPQNDVSGDTAKQGDDTEAEATSRTQADPATPDVSNDADSAQPSTRDPNTSPDSTRSTQDPTNGEPANENGRPERESSKPTEPDSRQTEADSRPDGRKSSQDAPNDPTTNNRDTPQQTTAPSDPRTSVPHQQTADPRTTDPRIADPRTTDPRTSDPRAADPHRDTPTQQKPETNERSDGRHPNTPQRPDPTHPDHVDDPRSETPDKDRSETPGLTRPDEPNQSPADDRRDRPSDMTKDSAVPTRESLPDGKNADAAGYVRDSTRGKEPLYGPITGETNAVGNRPHSDGNTTPPPGPAEPAARNSEDDKAFIRRMVDFANESRENRKQYWQKNGNRNSLDDRVDGQRLPQLKRDPDQPDDPDKFIAASEVPPPDAPDYMPEDIVKPVKLGREDGQITPENLEALDAETNNREWTLQADRIAEAAKLQAKADHGEDSEEYKAAKRVYADTHSAVRDIGENHGEYSALHHAMSSQHPEYVLVDVPHTGNGSDQFDQIYEDPNKPGHYIVVEAKAPTGQLGERNGHTGKKVMQGTREYFETINMLMREGTPEQRAIAKKLQAAYKLGNVQYVVVQSKVESDPEANAQANNGNHEGGYVGDDGHRDRKRYGGANMDYFDIRKPEDRQQ
ncbi:toxin glutamine deamidase domain-containing protein [Streptomyces sp. NBC_00445]|uniref:toxin glutamine deamidase domain-containing protein n=1 Tax=Streptomyces sp. NBC_00445 TaxID=2975745 RepID=UPI002E217D70